MKIGDLASATHTQVQTIRYYESLGLLPQAPRSEGNYRIYGAEHLARLGFIRHCRGLDMTLEEIRVLLQLKDSPERDCGDVNALLDAHIEQVATRMRELKQLQAQLKALRERCAVAQEASRCGILSGLAQGAAAAAIKPRSRHA